jgi:hypothetical protein
MYAPLAEQLPNVAQFEFTAGCSHNACTYCKLYEDVPFSWKRGLDFAGHAAGLLAAMSEEDPEALSKLDRIFVGNGDALSVPTSDLVAGLDLMVEFFHLYTQNVPRRIAMYATINNINSKSVSDLKMLHCLGSCNDYCSHVKYGTRVGVDLLYLGLETGDPKLLRIINKGYGRKKMYKAIKKIKKTKTSETKLDTSVFVIPGLGGDRFRDRHVDKTVEVLQRLKPKFLNLMTIKEHPGSEYAKWIDEQTRKNDNRRMTPDEIEEQIAEFVSRLGFGTIINSLDNSSYLGEDTNPVHFNANTWRRPGLDIILAGRIRDGVKTEDGMIDVRIN